MLECDDGTILKHIRQGAESDPELHFYQEVFDEACDDPAILELRQFLPKYLGVYSYTPPSFTHPGNQVLNTSSTRKFLYIL